MTSISGRIYAAEYTAGFSGRPASLALTIIANGRRTILETLPVAGKREARALATARGATPWNF